MRNKRKFTSFLLVLVFVLSTFLTDSKIAMAAGMEREGTEHYPFLIRTTEDLFDIAEKPYAYYKLMNDLDLENITRKPIDEFKGVLDGNGHIIKNLYILQSRYDNTGLFSKLTDATVKNITLKNPYVISNLSFSSTLCGYAKNSNISNCYSVDGKITAFQNCVGGLIGQIYSSNLYQCYSSTSIISSKDIVGGLIGKGDADSTITQCFTSCELERKSSIGGIAGVLGKADGSDNSGLQILDCYSNCVINSTDSSGIVGSTRNCNIKNCYVASPISSIYKTGLNGYGNTTSSYFDKTVLGLDTPTDQAKTTEQMY